MKTRIGIDDDHQTYLEAGRIAQETGRGGDRAARAHRGAALLGRGRLVRDRCARRARRHPGARQRRHLGGLRCPGDDRPDRMRRRRRRPGLPRPAVAVPRPGRCVRLRIGATAAEPRPGGDDDAAPCRAAGRVHGRGARLQGVPQAHRLVPQGFPGRRRAAPVAWARRHAGHARRTARRASTRTSRSRSPSSAARAGGRAARAGWPSPKAGSTAATTSGSTPPPRSA